MSALLTQAWASFFEAVGCSGGIFNNEFQPQIITVVCTEVL